MLSEMVMCVWHNSSISEVVAVNFRARSLQTRSESDRAWTKQYSFPSLHQMETTSVSKAMDVFYELIRGFTWMYLDILQLIDPA